MKVKRLVALVSAVGALTAGPFGSPASAASCGGLQELPAAWVCIVRNDVPSATLTPGPGVFVPTVCAFELGCVPGQWVYLPDVDLAGQVLVLYYDGTCYYVE